MNTTEYTPVLPGMQRGFADDIRQVGESVPFVFSQQAPRKTLFDRVEEAALARNGDLAVLLRLAQRWWRRDGYSYERIETLAAACHCSVRAMFDRERRLEACGDLYVRHRTWKHGNERLITAGLVEGEIARLLVKRMGLDEATAAREAAVVLARRQAGRGASTSGETCKSCRFKPATFAGAHYIYESTIESSSIGSLVVDDLGSGQQQQGLLSPEPGIEHEIPQPPLTLPMPTPGVRDSYTASVVLPLSPTPSPNTPVTVAQRRQAERKFYAEAQRGPVGTPPKVAPQGPTYAERKAERAAVLAGLDVERLALVRELAQMTSNRWKTADTMDIQELRRLVERLPEVVDLLTEFGYGGPDQPRWVEGLQAWYKQVWKETSSFRYRQGYPGIDRVIESLPGLGRVDEPVEQGAVILRDGRRLREFLVGQAWQAEAPAGVVLGDDAAVVTPQVQDKPRPEGTRSLVGVETVATEPRPSAEEQQAAPRGHPMVEECPAVEPGNRAQRAPETQRPEGSRRRGAGPEVTLEQVTIWAQCLAELKLTLPSATYNSWVCDMWLVAVRGPEAGTPWVPDAPCWVLGLPNGLALDWVQNRLTHKIGRMLASLVGQAVAVEFVIGEGVAP